MSNSNTTYVLAAGLGVIAGMRSMAAPAFVSRYLSRQRRRRSYSAVTRLLASRRTANVLGLLAIGEMVADKTPLVPDRTEPPALAGRLLMAAVSGVAVAEARGGSWPMAALISAAAAAGSTYGFYHLRALAARRTGLSNPALGLTEDAVVIASGSRLAAAIS